MLIRRIIPLLITLALAAGAVLFFLSGEKNVHALNNPVQRLPANTTSITHIADPAIALGKLNAIESTNALGEGFDLLKKVFADSSLLALNPSCAMYSTPNGFVLSLGVAKNTPAESLIHKWFPKAQKETGYWKSGDLAIFTNEENIFFTSGAGSLEINSTPTASDSLLLSTLKLAGLADLRIATLLNGNDNLQNLLHGDLASASDVHLTANGITSETVLLGKSQIGSELDGIPARWAEIIPDKVSKFEGIGFKSGAEASDKVIGSANKAGFNRLLADLETKYNTSADEMLYVWWNAGIGSFSLNKSEFTIVGTADPLLAASAFMKLPNAQSTSSNVGLIVTWDECELLNHLLSPFVKQEFKAALINEEIVLLASSASELSVAAALPILNSEHVLTRALEKNEHYVLYNENNDDESNLLWPWFKVQKVCVSGKSTNGHFFTSIQSGGEVHTAETATQVAWEYVLPNEATQSPTLIPDHRNGGYYVLVQDNQNVLHAISQKGSLLWTKEIGEPIIGKITPIDLYKNGKWQFAFTTKKEIHCIDIQGRNVKGYPVSSNQTITSPLFVADYDANRNYRLLAGCANGTIINIQGEGIKTAGWQHASANGAVVLMEHLKVGNKDYLFAASDKGLCYLLKRDGTPRMKTSATIAVPFECPNFRLTGDISSSSILYLDSLGQVYESVFGKEGSIPNESILIGADELALTDLDNDRLQEFVIGRPNAIECYRTDGSLLFTHPLNGAECDNLALYQFDNRQHIGFSIPSNDEINLIDQNGKQRAGFPQKGGFGFTIRDINQDNQLELISISGKKVILCYKL
jgi:outer membrane protein assembly factor BamB